MSLKTKAISFLVNRHNKKHGKKYGKTKRYFISFGCTFLVPILVIASLPSILFGDFSNVSKESIDSNYSTLSEDMEAALIKNMSGVKTKVGNNDNVDVADKKVGLVRYIAFFSLWIEKEKEKDPTAFVVANESNAGRYNKDTSGTINGVSPTVQEKYAKKFNEKITKAKIFTYKKTTKKSKKNKKTTKIVIDYVGDQEFAKKVLKFSDKEIQTCIGQAEALKGFLNNQGTFFIDLQDIYDQSVDESESTYSAAGNDLQQKVVKAMLSIEGKLNYTQSGMRTNIEAGFGDCSSTVAWCYKQVGINIGGFTGDQYKNAKGVDVETSGKKGARYPDESKLQPGDLLYFKGSESPSDLRPDGVGHVEMYIGNGIIMGHGTSSHKGPTKHSLKGYCNGRFPSKHYLKTRRWIEGGDSSGSGGMVGKKHDFSKLSASDKHVLYQVVQQEDGTGYKGALAVVSHLLNLVDYGMYRGSSVMHTLKSGWYEAYTSGAYLKQHPTGATKRAVKDAFNGKRGLPPWVLEYWTKGYHVKKLGALKRYKTIGDNDFYYLEADKKRLKNVKWETTTSNSTNTTTTRGTKCMIAIDAGHQSKSMSGTEAIGPKSNQQKAKILSGAPGEYKINLAIAKKLQSELQSRGYGTYMIRTTNDVSISNKQRALKANKSGAKLYIRIHCDDVDGGSSRHGISMQTPSGSNIHLSSKLIKKDRKLSNSILSATCKVTGAPNLGVQTTDQLTGTNWSKIATALIETGFLSNKTEKKKLKSAAYQKKLATGIANGVDNYLK